MRASACTATGPQKWEKELNLESIDCPWKTKFTNIGKILRENKLREFNFKLFRFHRLTVTKKELCTYGLNDETTRFYCKEPDYFSTDTFLERHFSQALYAKVVAWFNAKFNCFFPQRPTKNCSEQL